MRAFKPIATATTIVAFALAGTATAANTATSPRHDEQRVSATIAKSCSAGFRRARINGSVKCLRAGEYCAHRYDHRAPRHWSYRHYGYRCIKRDRRGAYHLTYA